MKAAVFFTLLCLITLSGNAQTDDDAKYEQAYNYYKAKEYDKAVPLLKELVNNNHAKALNMLGFMYQYSYGVEKDVNKAYDYYMRGAEKGNCYAQRNLAWLFQDEQFQDLHSTDTGGYQSEFDFDKQTEKWLRLAAQNNADYMYELADFYLNMQVLDEWQGNNPELYLKKAADAGSAIAQACLGYDNMLNKDYESAMKLFHTAKESGIRTFYPFYPSAYEENDELSIDACLAMLQYMKNNPEIKLNSSSKYDDDNYLLSVSKGADKNGLILLSNTGRFVAKTPFFNDIWLYKMDQNIQFPYISFRPSQNNYNANTDVTFLNKSIKFDVMEGISRFLQQNKDLKIVTAHYTGEAIYITVKNENEQYRYIKIDMSGKIIKSTPFISETLRVYYNSNENVLDLYCRKIYLIDSHINFDIVFPVFDFLSNSDYRTDYGEVLFVNNNYLMIHVQKREGNYYHDYKWFKLSPAGKILGETKTQDDAQISYAPDKRNFYLFNNGQKTEISLQEMQQRFK